MLSDNKSYRRSETKMSRNSHLGSLCGSMETVSRLLDRRADANLRDTCAAGHSAGCNVHTCMYNPGLGRFSEHVTVVG